jgi:uncharacterized protein (DUF488 family)
LSYSCGELRSFLRALDRTHEGHTGVTVSDEPKGITIYTIGHSNVQASEIIGLLNAHGIRVLVDVRSVPYSQYTSQFNREQLSRSLEAAGITYAFAGEYLGGHPSDPSCYVGGEVPTGKSDFLKSLDFDAVEQRDWYKTGISRPVEIARAQPTAIMCSEEDPSQCHRHHLISQTLLKMGLSVRHIRKQGSLEEAITEERARQLNMF